jgi:hypothetical protein
MKKANKHKMLRVDILRIFMFFLQYEIIKNAKIVGAIQTGL